MFEGGGRGGEPSATEHFESVVGRRAEVDPRVSVEKTIRDILKASHAENDFLAEEFSDRKIEIAGKIESKEAHEALGELMTEFEKKHDFAESNVDPYSPESKIEYLLSLLIECGGDWSAQKRKAVRRIAYNYVLQSLARVQNTQLMNALNENLLQDNFQKEFGELKSEEQKLVISWLQK